MFFPSGKIRLFRNTVYIFIWNYDFSKFVSTHHFLTLPLTSSFTCSPLPRQGEPVYPTYYFASSLCLHFSTPTLYTVPTPSPSISRYPKPALRDFWQLSQKWLLVNCQKRHPEIQSDGGDLRCQKPLLCKRERAGRWELN